jgi:tripartite-type tricarboxylate transporter receptor subunit TctC
MLSRRHLLAGLGAGVAIAAAAGVRFRRTPTAGAGPCAAVAGRTIRWIVPNAAGGGYDTESRMLQPFLERQLGAEIAVDNVPGAGGIIGARAIAAARPDGLTLGMVGMPGLLLAALIGTAEAPDPVRAFSVLARLGRSWHVWASGASSPLKTLDDLLEEGRRRALVFAVNEVGSANMASITVTADLLGVDVELVAGFGGTRPASMAALRGDVDLVCFDFETIRELVEGGDLRPVLQVSASPISRHAALGGVPLLGGPDGMAARRAGLSGRSEADTRELAAALFAVMGSGRLVVAPSGLDPGVFRCLSLTLHETLASGDVQAAAARPLDVAAADAALADVRAASSAAPPLLPVLLAAMRRVRH